MADQKSFDELCRQFKSRSLKEELGWAAYYTRRGYMRACDADYYRWLAYAAFQKITELEEEKMHDVHTRS